MKKIFLLATILILLSGCAALAPRLSEAAKAEPNTGFITAQSYTSTARGFAIVVKNIETGTRYGMELGEDGPARASLADVVNAIKVPAGKYQVVSWSSDGFGLVVQSIERKGTEPAPLLDTFTVSERSVVSLGRFILANGGSTRAFYTEISTSIRSGRVSLKEVQDAFHRQYPAVQESSFTCLACVDY